MTSPPIAVSSATAQPSIHVHEHCIQQSMGRLQLSNGSVRITFRQPEDVGSVSPPPQALNSIAAAKQCQTHAASHPNQEFEVELKEGLPDAVVSEEIQVTLQSPLLQKLPLLNDVQNSTTSDSKVVDLDLPCSVWGFVSLLILLEGSVSVKEWFGGSSQNDHDPSLPAHTLQVHYLALDLD